jgi:transcriptional regulator with XRE-family HTH domain
MVKKKEGEQEKVWGAVEWVGHRLKELRELRGMTGEEVAEKMGVKYTRVYDAESARNDMRASTIFAFLDAIGVEFEHFARTAPKRGVAWYSKETPSMKKERRTRMKQNSVNARQAKIKKKPRV